MSEQSGPGRSGITRHRIDAVRPERMAFHDAARREPSPGEQPMLLDRLDGIRRARRLEAAGAADERRQQQLIGVNQRHSETCGPGSTRHTRPRILRMASEKSASTTAKFASRIARRGIATKSSPLSPRSPVVSGSCRRKISRKRRFARLRATAFPNLREAIKPKRS